MAQEFHHYRRRLPHYHLAQSTYFVTWRLHRAHAQLGPAERDLVVSALRHFEGSRYRLLAFVVMDDHVHVIVRPSAEETLLAILHGWKSFTANALQKRHGRRGAIWQDETYDHVVRHDDELIEKAEYIRHNPFKRWPELTSYPWLWVAEDSR